MVSEPLTERPKAARGHTIERKIRSREEERSQKSKELRMEVQHIATNCSAIIVRKMVIKPDNRKRNMSVFYLKFISSVAWRLQCRRRSKRER